jgi:hypothetical protein
MQIRTPAVTVKTMAAITSDEFALLQGSAEFGIYDPAVLAKLADTLIRQPDLLLPQRLAQVRQIAFFFEHAGMHPVAVVIEYWVLRWQLLRGDHRGAAATAASIAGIAADEDDLTDPEAISQRALADPPRLRGWRLRFDRGDGLRSALDAGVPTTTYRGWLRSMDTARLNDVGRALLKNAFARFAGVYTDWSEFDRHIRRLQSFGVRYPDAFVRHLEQARLSASRGVAVSLGLHRRYAGGDGRLPRSCYFTLCDESGDDSGTLAQEIAAYADFAIPGLVLVADTAHPLLRNWFERTGQKPPPQPAIVVILLAPEDPAQRRTFELAYADVLALTGGAAGRDSWFVMLEAQVREVEIGNVLDLRRPKAQEWFFRTFRTGDPLVFAKPNGTDANGFFDILPTLLHPQQGGCAATTGIGTWLRTLKSVDALIYPSARADVGVIQRDGAMVDHFGWCLLDYRKAAPLDLGTGEVTVDGDPWNLPDGSWALHRRGAVLRFPTMERIGFDGRGSWEVSGHLAPYHQRLRSLFGA